MVNIRTGPIIHDLFVYVTMGMNVSMKRKDNKTVMEHKKHDNVTVVTPSQLGTPVTPVMSPDFIYYSGLSS